MGRGGGTFLAQNKVLPGAYINFIAFQRASASLSDRGIATVPLILDWGALGEVVEVTQRDFQRNSKRIFGYDFTHPKMRPLREVFSNIRILQAYRLGTGGVKASNDFATAAYAGIRGNNISITIAPNVDDASAWDVITFVDNTLVDSQTVASAVGLVANDYVSWKSDLTLEATAGTPLAGGVNPTVANADFQSYLDAIESYSFNAIGCPSGDSGIKALFTAFTKRMRDEQGVKFQCVTYGNAADFEGVINIMNKPKDAGTNEYDLVWWTTGIIAGTAVNRSATNNVYNGEYTVDVKYSQIDFERAILAGKFAFYRAATNEIRVLEDINSLVTLTADKNDDFRYNQTIRVIDQIANDIAVLFNTRFLGEMPNDDDGRISFWSAIVQHHSGLQTIRAIQDFSPDHVTVEQGETRRSVAVNDRVMPVNAMTHLYMTVMVA